MGLRTELQAVLAARDTVDPDELMDLIRETIIQDETAIGELFPDDVYSVTIRCKRTGIGIHHQLAKANRASTEAKRKARNDKWAEVVTYLTSHGLLDLPRREQAIRLNASNIKPPKGDAWNRDKVQRLLGASEDESGLPDK
ncbi:hypothetical protein [Aureimonas sp. AU40]|uniref:hypothetical protein n=1 Tax=Aureimonas sp. AU40 TaxID=1637747 RepID=UPI0007854B44|nr:hypothetical protein [Aureimonas sp. AU40]